MHRNLNRATTNRDHAVYALAILCLTFGLLSTACKPSNTGKRYYREVVITRPAAQNALPSGHTADDGHDHSQDMALPDGHPSVGSPGMDPNALPASMRSGAGVALAWDTPTAWTETAGQGMRRATFTVADSEVQCTIVALGGSAGGTESNLSRWLGQVNLSLSADELSAMVKGLESGATSSGLAVQWVNFNPLVSSPDAPSMIAAILEKEGSSVFVKMTGPASALTDQEPTLRQLVESIR